MYFKTRMNLLFSSDSTRDKYDQHLDLMTMYYREKGIREETIKPTKLPAFIKFECWIEASGRLYKCRVAEINGSSILVVPSFKRELAGKQSGILTLGSENYTFQCEVKNTKELHLSVKGQEAMVRMSTRKCSQSAFMFGSDKTSAGDDPTRTIVYDRSSNIIFNKL